VAIELLAMGSSSRMAFVGAAVETPSRAKSVPCHR
jgi:hypothetical protein